MLEEQPGVILMLNGFEYFASLDETLAHYIPFPRTWFSQRRSTDVQEGASQVLPNCGSCERPHDEEEDSHCLQFESDGKVIFVSRLESYIWAGNRSADEGGDKNGTCNHCSGPILRHKRIILSKIRVSSQATQQSSEEVEKNADQLEDISNPDKMTISEGEDLTADTSVHAEKEIEKESERELEQGSGASLLLSTSKEGQLVISNGNSNTVQNDDDIDKVNKGEEIDLWHIVCDFWKDQDVIDSDDFVRVWETVNAVSQSHRRNQQDTTISDTERCILVHCTGGVGRTGSFITVDIAGTSRIYIYIYIYRERERERQTDKE